MSSLVLLLLTLATVTAGNYPILDVSTLMRMLLVPVDTKIGSAIYRLRGTDSDFDFPLHFDVLGAGAEPVVRIENLPCSRNQTYCEANVLLARNLELGRVYDLKLRVRDTRGDTTSVPCTIRPTNSSTPIDTIFPHLPLLVIVPENTNVGTELDYVIARKNPKNTRHASLELWGSSNFAIRQSLASPDTVNGTIVLTQELDFEQQSMYMLTVFAVDAYAEPDNDTRNLVAFTLAVAVQDVQDMPPIFTTAPPVTVLNNTLQKGDVVLEVHAEDGDKGIPRDLRYGIVSEGNPFTSFFNIDQKTGKLSLAKPLKELRKITQPHQPILLTIMAEEVKTGVHEPFAMSSTVLVALVMSELDNTPPYFDSDKYVAWMDENSPQGKALIFNDPYIAEIRDDDLGKNGVFSISLTNNNGTFEISPTVGESRASFVIRVRNNSLLDYEQRHYLVFTIEAREVGPKTSLSSSAQVTVYIRDQNDNPPVFRESIYRAELTENATAGTKVIQVAADDVDEGENGEIAYASILRDNSSLQIDDKNGWITVKTNRHIFDRESAKEFLLYVVAADRNGKGNSATATLVITVLDVNDHAPTFPRTDYEFVLKKDLTDLTTPALIAAFDGDAESPNNEVQYEIVSGNLNDMFRIDPHTGELTVRNTAISSKIREESKIQKFNLLVRAYDLGVPYKSNTVPVLVYPPEPNARNMTFILNGYPVDAKETEEMLSRVTGGRVKIQNVQPLPVRKIRSVDSGKSSDDKSVVSARVLYDDNPTVDLTQFQTALLNNQNTTVVHKEEKVEEYHRAESALFWILMLLAALIVIVILLLLLCCICPGCPLYANPKKGQQVDPQADTVHLVVKENGNGMETKAVQAEWSEHRREAWSADQRHQSWRFNRRNVPNKEHEDLRTVPDDRQHIYDINGPAAASVSMRELDDRHSLRSLPNQHFRLRDRPTIVYTRDLHDIQRLAELGHRDIYVEDIEGNEYPPESQILDNRPVRGRIHHREIRINAEEDHDTDSMIRHEVERGSDLGRGSDYRRNDANRDMDKEGREYRLLLHRGSNQRPSYARTDEAAAGLSTLAASRREPFYIRDGDAEILRLVTRGRSLDEQEFAQVAPQPQQRPMTLVAPRQHNSVRADDGKEIIMQRFMEDQRNNNSTRHAEEADDRGLLTSFNQQDVLVRRLLEEEARLNNTLLLTEALVAQRQHEQYLATAGENIETQSLPGQTTMATQTDVDSSTQTEPMHLMRPPRRRARSDNDDSYTEDDEQEEVKKKDAVKLSSSGNAVYGFWIRKHRSKRRRNSFHRGDLRVKRAGGRGGFIVSGKRHKIKTPILEETESALEAAEGTHDYIAFGSYAQNKSSMLRRRKNKAKIATAAGDVEVTTLPNELQNYLDDGEETPTDSLEEGSPSNKNYSLSNNVTDSHRNTRTAQTISASVGDVRHVNFEDGGALSSKTHRIEFVDSEFGGNSSDTWNISGSKRRSIPEKGRVQAATYAASSDSNGRPSEQESSAEAKESERLTIPEYIHEKDINQIRSARSDRGLNISSSSRMFRRSSVPNSEKFDKKNRSSRRGSLSEPGRSEVQDLSQRQTLSSRAKSVSHINEVGNRKEDHSVSGPAPRKGSRYMEWYKTKREERERRKQEEKEKKKEKQKKKNKPSQSIVTDTKAAKNSEKEKKGPLTENRGQRKIVEEAVDKELERAEEQILKVTVLDDDIDSGIAMSSMVVGAGGRKKRNQQLLEKKSVFTIAYDDMQTKQLRPESNSPPY